MSDKDFFENSDESESGEDFSASEDEWQPGKDDKFSDEDDEDQGDASNSEEEEQHSKKESNKRSKSQTVNKPKKASRSSGQTSSLRSKLFKRYNPPPKAISNLPLPSKVAEILSNSQFKQRKQMSSANAAGATSTAQSDSESSEDEGLVKPSQLDLNSEFFDVKCNQPKQTPSEAPVFDCNAGVRLSDSSESDDDEFCPVESETKVESTNKPSIVDQINKKSSSEVHDFSSLQNFAKNLESAKAHLEKLTKNETKAATVNADESDINKLLSMGESSTTISAPNGKRKQREDDQSDSDWENVTDDEKAAGVREIKDIEITVGNGDARLSRDQKKAIDIEACLKRRLNRDIKEKQVYLHKTSVLCWTAHGNYINRSLNHTALMEMCLKLLPSKNSYPKGPTDLKYYHMITDWFHNIIQLKSDNLFCELQRLPGKVRSLALQIQSKAAISKSDFVLLFVTMLRTLGIQCRLVINFALPPLRPPQKDLFVISSKAKPADEENEEAKKSKPTSNKKTSPKNSKTLAKKIKISAEKMKGSFKDKPSKSSTKAARNSCDLSKPPKTTQSKIDNGHAASSPINGSRLSESGEVKENTRNGKEIEGNQNEFSSTAKNAGATRRKVGNAAKSQARNEEGNHAIGLFKTIVGTPTKHKLIERTNCANVVQMKNGKNVSETFSPRKTRSVKATNIVATVTSNARHKLKLPQLDGADDCIVAKIYKRKAKTKTKQNESENDSDFAPSPPKRIRTKLTPQKPVKKTSTKKTSNVQQSTDDDTEADGTNRMNFWVEAYAEKEKKWIVIDPVNKKVDCVDHIRRKASKPMIYVFAWNNDSTIRDVTPRYCAELHTTTRKLRADQLWIDIMLDKLLENDNPRTIIEDIEFSKLHMDTPLPTSINEFKNHPLYALERHLLKFEGIYPPNALTLGFIRKEPIYSRDCVHTLHSREIWVKQARTVKLGEKPYKIVKARPKWNRVLNQMEEAKPLEIFGFWQTEPYKPPIAENGVVPRNPYGNVELFKPEMLPIGTRHIQLPNLNRVCKKMGVDCAQAVVGFDFHGGSSHPTFDGFVVCEEFADDVITQWEFEQEETIGKEKEKREARVYGNWKKLIKGLLIRERLKRKFNFGVDTKADKGSKRNKAA